MQAVVGRGETWLVRRKRGEGVKAGKRVNRRNRPDLRPGQPAGRGGTGGGQFELEVGRPGTTASPHGQADPGQGPARKYPHWRFLT